MSHSSVRAQELPAFGEQPGFAEWFWTQADKSSVCWEWTGSRQKGRGYGMVTVAGRRRRAHRVAYALSHGGVADGVSILHACDNPPCVRASHLFPGDQRANMEDMARKLRSGCITLTPDQVQEIRVRRAALEPIAAIASDMRIDRAHAFLIGVGKKRPHLPKPEDFAARVQRYREEAARRGIRLLEPREPVHQVRALTFLATGHSYTQAAQALGVSRGRVWNALHPGTKRPTRRAVINLVAPVPNTILPPPRPLGLTDEQILALARRLALFRRRSSAA